MAGPKTEIKRELTKIRREIKSINEKRQEDTVVIERNYASNATNLLDIVKYLMNENKKTTMLLKNIHDSMERMEGTLMDLGDEQQSKQAVVPIQQGANVVEVPVSELDAKIVQIIQVSGGMACADDIKSQMEYKGRNAASARLNRLHRAGIIERYQLGRRVYYKYDAGRATNMLIVSPHSKLRPQQ